MEVRLDSIFIDIDSNFWEVNPQFKYITEFKDLYTKDKSKNKENSSRIMWTVIMYVDPIRSLFSNMSEENRKAELTHYLGKVKHDWEEIIYLGEVYMDKSLTKAERAFKAWTDKMLERDEFIRDTSYDISSAEALDKIMKNSKDIWTHYEKVKESLEKAQAKGNVRGDRKESPSELGVV